MLKSVLASVVVAWLPGAVLYRLPWFNRDRRAALAAEERLFWAVMISIAVSLSATLALGAVHRYSFFRLLVCDIAIAAVAAAAARLRLRFGAVARRPGLTALVPIGLIVLSLWRFFPSAEYIVGGRDPGTYTNEGVQIAQRGALVVRDPVIASVPNFARNLFFPSHERQDHLGTRDYYGLRFMGFFIRNPEDGAVVGQFPHLFPASIAIAYGIDGLSGARHAVGFWAVLGVLAVYFAGARLVGRRAAAAGAALLTLHIVQVWFARYPNAEMPMQALLFGALLANARAHADGDSFFAPIAGVLLGLLLFTSLSVLIGIAAVLGGLALGVFNGNRLRWSFFAVLALASALAIPYYLGPLRAYASLYLGFVVTLPWWQLVVIALVAIAVAAGVLLASRLPALSAAVVQVAPTAIALVVVLLAAYALFLRHPAGRLAAADAYALRTFTGIYFTLPALLAALIGFVLISQRSFWRDPALLVTLAVFSIFLFYKPRIVPEHFWVARRFVPIVLPGALLFAGAAAFAREGGGWRGARVLRPLIGLAFVGVLAAHYIRVTAPILPHSEYAGLIARMEQLAATVAPDDLVIAESRDAGTDVHVLALPLAYIYARNVVVLHSPAPDKATLSAFVDWARTKYSRVLFIGSGGSNILSHRYGLESIASDRYQVPEWEKTTDRLPRTVRQKEFDYGVYRFTPPLPIEGTWFDLDIGTRDDLHVVRFHAKEPARAKPGDTTFRWTRRQSFITVTVVPKDARQVTLVMSNGGRPAAAPAATVEVWLHNQLLGVVRVDDGFKPYTVAIPPDLAGRAASAGDPVELRLVTTVWNPLKVLGTADDRDLGVMVDRVAVR
jgi:hypothetical protein